MANDLELQAHASVGTGNSRPLMAQRWLRQVFALSIVGVMVIVLTLVALAGSNRLPAPPLTATACLDEKLAFTRSAALEEATLLAIGSSATWRNLDMRRLEQSQFGVRALNAATCYLHVDQIAFLTELLLERAARVTYVLTVLALRDFENCDPKDTKIAQPTLTRAYLLGILPGWVVHFVNFRPSYILHQAFTIKAERAGLLSSDQYGSSPAYRVNNWNPPPVVDQRCFDALERLESSVAGKNARLVVATVPVMPRWSAEFDPNKHIVAHWTDGVRAKLSSRTMFVDGRMFLWPDEGFADPVHLLWPKGAEYTEFIAAAIAVR